MKVINCKNNTGITISSLVVTIVIMLILAGVAVTASIQGGLIGTSKESKYKAEVQEIIEKLETKKVIENNSNISGSLADTLGITDEYNSKYTITNAELIYIGNSKDEAKWSLDIGINENNIQNKSLLCLITGEHIWNEANYLYAKNCSLCGFTEGEPLDYPTSPHPEQKNSTDIGIGTNGELVNLDLWKYSLYYINEKNVYEYQIFNETSKSAYLGEFISGEINGYVPQKINGINVTRLWYTFYNCTQLIKMPKIPSTVTSMNYCFTNCTNLKETTKIPESVNAMQTCFRGCTSLETAPEIPNNVSKIAELFRECISLKSVKNIPTAATAIEFSFYNCTSLTTIPEIHEGITNLNRAFQGCTSLEEINIIIPSTVTNLTNTFNGCTKLTGKIKILSEEITNITTCFYNVNTNVTVEVKDNSTTYNSFTSTYGDTPNIIIKTF